MGSPAKTWKTGKKVQTCSGLHCEHPSKCFQFVIFFFKGEKEYSCRHWYCCGSTNWEPKQNSQTARITKLFNLSKDHNARKHVVRKPPNRVQNLGPRHTRVSVCISHVLQHKHQYITLRKWCTEKKKRGLQNTLNLWPRKWRRPKENARKRLPREGGCPLRKLPPLMPVKTKMWVASTTEVTRLPEAHLADAGSRHALPNHVWTNPSPCD